MTDACLAFGMPGSWEWILILVVALLIFGRRLPDVARSIGKSIVEFKKGIRDVKDEIDDGTRLEPPKSDRLERKLDSTVERNDAASTSTNATDAPTRPSNASH